jgi:hypothetical protein
VSDIKVGDKVTYFRTDTPPDADAASWLGGPHTVTDIQANSPVAWLYGDFDGPWDTDDRTLYVLENATTGAVGYSHASYLTLLEREA